MQDELKDSELATIGVVYLARFAEGIDAFQRFIESYRQNPAGWNHDLVIIYKGFDKSEDLQKAKAVFSEVPHLAVELDDTGFDIGSYLEVARRVTHDYLLFFNTYTEFNSPNWLTHLYAHASRDDVGIVGAMGSYESIFDSFGLIQKVIFYCEHFGQPYDRDIHEYFAFIVDHHCRNWIDTAPAAPREAPIKRRSLLGNLANKILLLKMGLRWLALTGPKMPFESYRNFPPFPNPHVRSNGFMVRRDRLLEFQSPAITSKMDACAFESGIMSITSQFRHLGLEAVVVGRDGKGYRIADWPRSDTFRLGDQRNLLISDNQTRQFAKMPDKIQATHVHMTWGKFIDWQPDAFPDLGTRFSGDLATISSPPRYLFLIDRTATFARWFTKLRLRHSIKIYLQQMPGRILSAARLTWPRPYYATRKFLKIVLIKTGVISQR